MAKKAKPKKRGVKPGTKRGKYKKAKTRANLLMQIKEETKPFKINWKVLKASENETPFTPEPLTLCGQLEDAVMLLETRISNVIAKINSLM